MLEAFVLSLGTLTMGGEGREEGGGREGCDEARIFLFLTPAFTHTTREYLHIQQSVQ